MILISIVIFLTLFWGVSHAFEDPWSNLRKHYENSDMKQVIEKEQYDPWRLLRAVYLPFSISEERRAGADPEAAEKFIRKFNSRLLKYDVVIKKAAKTFDIPEEVIKAVIMAESGGDRNAKAKTTSAKGLMQTIDSTFLMAKKGLAKQGICISDDPFDPESSIMAGVWYLSRMYEKCITDGRVMADKTGNNETVLSGRKNISKWRYPLEYYYAGPVHGAEERNKIYVFSNGKRRMIDKRAYSKKIQKWAQILAV